MPDAYKIIENVPHKWVANPGGGGTWQPLPPDPAGEAHNAELLKQALTFGGGVLGGAALPAAAPALAEATGLSEALPTIKTLLRLGGSAAGGAGGRVAGHELAYGDQETVPHAATVGGGEGLLNEALPTMLGPVTEAGGKVLRFLGRAGFDNPEWGPWLRARVAQMRGTAGGTLGYAVGGPAGAGVGGTLASMGPIAATEGGKRLERLGAGMSRAPLSERATDALDALLSKVWPAERPMAAPLTAAEHAERLSAAAEGTPQFASQNNVRVNRTQPFTSEGPASSQQPWTPPPSPAAPRTSTGDPMHVDTRTDFRPDVTVGQGGVASEPPPPPATNDVRVREDGPSFGRTAPPEARPPVQGDWTDPQSRSLGLDRPNISNAGDAPFWHLKDTAIERGAPWWEEARPTRPGPTIEAEGALRKGGPAAEWEPPPPPPKPKAKTPSAALRNKVINPTNLTPDELVDFYPGGNGPDEPPPPGGGVVATPATDVLANQVNAPHSGATAAPTTRTLPDGRVVYWNDAEAEAEAAAAHAAANPPGEKPAWYHGMSTNAPSAEFNANLAEARARGPANPAADAGDTASDALKQNALGTREAAASELANRFNLQTDDAIARMKASGAAAQAERDAAIAEGKAAKDSGDANRMTAAIERMKAAGLRSGGPFEPF